jgi:hypothetical protein
MGRDYDGKKGIAKRRGNGVMGIEGEGKESLLCIG